MIKVIKKRLVKIIYLLIKNMAIKMVPKNIFTNSKWATNACKFCGALFVFYQVQLFQNIKFNIIHVSFINHQ